MRQNVRRVLEYQAHHLQEIEQHLAQITSYLGFLIHARWYLGVRGTGLSLKRILQTRNVGMKPDASGHLFAPMEIVYECEEPKRDWSWLWPLALALAGLALTLL